MEQKAKSFATSNAPWRRGIGWPIVLIEGLALLGIGIYALAATDSARSTVMALFGIILLVNGIGTVLSNFRQPPNPATAYRSFRGGVAVTTGFLALIGRFSDALDINDARLILGFGFLGVGLIGLATLFLAKTEARFPIGASVWQLVMIGLGVTMLTGGGDSDTRLTLLGWVATILGILLCGLAALIQQGKIVTGDGNGSAGSAGVTPTNPTVAAAPSPGTSAPSSETEIQDTIPAGDVAPDAT